MMTLVMGGAASGKSAYAESLLCGDAAAGLQKVYLATMQPFGKEAEERIRKHRAMRAGKGFETAECGTAREILALPVSPDTAVLLEDLGNLCANELFSAENENASPETGEANAAEAVVRAVSALSGRCADLVAVANEVFSDGAEYEEETFAYLHMLGQVSMALAAMADQVIEVQCGIPVILKDARQPEYSPDRKQGMPSGRKDAESTAGPEKRSKMVFVTGPMFSGKREAAAKLLGKEVCSISEVQALAAECRDEKDLEQLADRLSEYDLVISSETGCGVVPMDRETRDAREMAGRLNCLLAARADTVIRVFCGIPQVIKGEV